MLDNTTSAVFGDQTILVLADGQHFDASKRGLALAGAGRSASASTASAASLTESCSRDTHLRTLQSFHHLKHPSPTLVSFSRRCTLHQLYFRVGVRQSIHACPSQ